jgi:hypothetical protein
VTRLVESLLFLGPLLLIKPAWAWIGWPSLPLLFIVGLALSFAWGIRSYVYSCKKR